jgi:hypothetical protein
MEPLADGDGSDQLTRKHEELAMQKLCTSTTIQAAEIEQNWNMTSASLARREACMEAYNNLAHHLMSRSVSQDCGAHHAHKADENFGSEVEKR